MRKLLFLLFIPLFISCGKDEAFENTATNTENILDEIKRTTGCIPTDAESIVKYKSFTDNQNIKYLFGSKNKDAQECFWFAQYDANGKQNWEIVIKGDVSSFAYMPTVINNGNVVVGNVAYSDIPSSNGIIPVMIEPKNGKYKQIKIRENYFYTDVFAFDDCFFCSINQHELLVNMYAKEWYVQLSNSGEIMYQADCMNIPSGKPLFINEHQFINITPTKVSKESLKCSEGLYWEYPVSLPENSKCEMNLSLDGDDISAIYNIVLTNGEQKTIEYKLSCNTGKEPVRVTGVKLPDIQAITIGEELYLKAQVIPENASVTDLIWQSSDNNIATVDSEGKIKAISIGECNVTVSTVDGNYQDMCNIHVKSITEVSGVIINPTSDEIYLGTTKQLVASVLPSTAINKGIHWSSSDESIVSVDQNGNITANATGTAIISVETIEGNYTAACAITVYDITRFIGLGFSATVTITGKYVTGSILSTISNNSEETITITKMEITDGYGNLFANASSGVPKTLKPGDSYSLGSNNFNHVYFPIFLWYFECKDKSYCIKHQYPNSITTSQAFKE